ncbi:MAG: plasmid mobilization protein [Blastocatellia bacterium]
MSEKIYRKVIFLRVTEDEHHELTARAARHGSSVSRFIVNSILASIVPPESEFEPYAGAYSSQIKIRTTPEQRLLLATRAAIAAQSLSRFILQRALTAPDPPPAPPPAPPNEAQLTLIQLKQDILYHLRATGRNLNQLVHRAHIYNSTGETIEGREVVELVAELSQTIERALKVEELQDPRDPHPKRPGVFNGQ